MKKFKYIILFISIALFLTTIGVFAASILGDGQRVMTNSELIYYLDVTYDGVNSQGQKSNGTTKIDLESKYIYVEDKLPEGLIFTGFVESSDGSIGATTRDGKSRCAGYVVDDTGNNVTTNTYHGLHYDPNTRKVTFTVRNLQAGCKLTVGIKTKTPLTVDDLDTPEKETRRDFYNTASATDNILSVISNTVHVWIGTDEATEAKLYPVTYKYVGSNIPDNAPTLPEAHSYVEGATVGVENDVSVQGYKFSGWTSTQVSPNSSKTFKMPGKAVEFTGYFTELPKYQVVYQITGSKPEQYTPPATKSYYQNDIVTRDALKAGDVIDGYRFKGWTTSSVTVNSDNEFTMPNKTVTFTGQFEEITYNVEYRFEGNVLPTNANNLLPTTRSYKPGTTVTVASNPTATGYKFSGWYSAQQFEMPENDVIIYGEWSLETGKFEPKISKSIINDQGTYMPGDTVKYQITVTNTANFTIKDVMISENNEKAYFTAGSGYEILTDRMVKITSIAAGKSATVYAEYKVTEADKGTIKNEVEIVGALADNNYNLNTDKEYKDTATFKAASKLTVCKTVSGTSNNAKFQIHITESSYDTWLVLDKNTCKSVYVKEGSYKIEEVIPMDYTIQSVTGISANKGTLSVKSGTDYEVRFTNKYNKSSTVFHVFGSVINQLRGVNS